MIRPLLLIILAGSTGCAGSDAPPPSSAAAIPPVAGRPAPRPGAAGQSFASPPPSQATRDRAAVAEACRRDADRIVLYRDRGQLMREDDRDARVGTDASPFARRFETDRLGRVFERDRIAAECMQQDSPSPSPSPRR